MERLNTHHPLHPNFKMILLVVVSALLLLSILLASRKPQIDERLLSSTITVSHQQVLPEKPLAVRIQADSLGTTLESALKGSMAGQQKTGYTEIPKGTHLLGYSVSHNVVTVDLSKEFQQGAGSTSAIQRVEDLKKAVRRVNPNYRLKIAVEGKPITLVTSDGLELNSAI